MLNRKENLNQVKTLEGNSDSLTSGDYIERELERIFTFHTQVVESGFLNSGKQAELIYELISSKIKTENSHLCDVQGYLSHLAQIDGANLKNERILKILKEIKGSTRWEIEKEMIDSFLRSNNHPEGLIDQEEIKNIFYREITWKDIEKLFIDLERTPGKAILLGRILDIYRYEYFLDFQGNDVVQEVIFFDEELHIRFSNRASEFQNDRIVEVLVRGIREQGSGKIVRKAIVVTSFRA